MGILIQSLLRYQNNILKNISLSNKRFLYNQISSNEKLIGIVGLRGTGKTTILLQKLKENKYIEQSIYFSMDNPKISSKGLLEIVDDLYFNYGYRYFYVDEIHKYANWNQELKNIYDSFPDIRLIFSGSSSVDIIKGTYDLSRRVLLLKLPVLSFREYLNFKYDLSLEVNSLQGLLNNKGDTINYLLDKNIAILKEFKNYLNFGEFPFFLLLDNNTDNYKFKVDNIINKIIYEDVSSFYKLKTQNLHVFKEIIYFIINSEPGLFNYNSLSKFLSISSETLKVYIKILEEIGLLKIISYAGNISQETRKAKKVYFTLNNINEVEDYVDIKNIGRIRESFFINNVSYILRGGIANEKIRYSDIGDFSIQLKGINYILEVGGKNKTKKQIKGISNSFLVKDDTIDIGNNTIPLWLFGFLY